VIATAAGLSALIASSQTVFATIHYAGAAYLCWLGVSALRTAHDGLAADAEAGPAEIWPAYRHGVIVELGNPKVALFFLALFPQFVHRTAGPAWMQIIVLGAIVPFALFVGALHHIPATRASIVAMFEPVVASAVAWAWLGESLDAVQVVGGAVVLGGIVLAQTARGDPDP